MFRFHIRVPQHQLLNQCFHSLVLVNVRQRNQIVPRMLVSLVFTLNLFRAEQGLQGGNPKLGILLVETRVMRFQGDTPRSEEPPNLFILGEE